MSSRVRAEKERCLLSTETPNRNPGLDEDSQAVDFKRTSNTTGRWPRYWQNDSHIPIPNERDQDLRRDGAFVSLDETKAHYYREMALFGWKFEELEKGKKFAFINASPLRHMPGEVKIGRTIHRKERLFDPQPHRRNQDSH